MGRLKKIAKIWGFYALITGYCYYFTDQIIIMTDREVGANFGKLEFEFPWKHILDNCKKIFNNIKLNND